MERLYMLYYGKKKKLSNKFSPQYLWAHLIGITVSVTILEGAVDPKKPTSWGKFKNTVSWKQHYEILACVTYVGTVSSDRELLSQWNENI